MMYKSKDGFQFDAKYKVEEYEKYCTQCFGGCRNVNDPPEEACCECAISSECELLCKELEE